MGLFVEIVNGIEYFREKCYSKCLTGSLIKVDKLLDCINTSKVDTRTMLRFDGFIGFLLKSYLIN